LLEKAINAWRFDEARQVLDKLLASEREMPEAAYLEGKLLFFEGECEKALKSLRKAIEASKSDIGWKALRDRAEETEQVFSKLAVKKSADGKFLFRFASGPDAMLVPYAEEALGKQLAALVALFGDRPKRPIEVDLMPDMLSLSRASGLSVEQMARTGTVGVTKYGRVMVITPRKLVTGYPWLHTMAHELTHFFITRVSHDKAPIWLHEGIAKLLENLWQNDEMQILTPEEGYLLDRAVKEGRLIPLKRFHPSVAYMPDQEEAALAYAQVLSFTRYLNQRLEEGWIRRALSGMSVGYNLDYLMTEMSGSDLKRHYHWWRQAAAGKRHTPVPAVGLLKRRFKRGEVTGATRRESPHSQEVRRHLRVGDLLRLRGHLKAAVVEFSEAEKLAKSPSTEIGDRLAGSLLALGDHKRVIQLLIPMVNLYPYHSTTRVQLGRALAAEKREWEAIEQLKLANAINPFHPEVHCLLAELHRQVKKTADAKTEEAHCKLAARFAGEDLGLEDAR
jgi:tetratricopeptide (TPR) repeat protein